MAAAGLASSLFPIGRPDVISVSSRLATHFSIAIWLRVNKAIFFAHFSSFMADKHTDNLHVLYMNRTTEEK
jgi:hypothetical protein